MVLENLVANILNGFLSDYVENLDASQLNVGILGRNVKLNDLKLRETVFDILNLPFKVKFGCVNNLTIKFPWTNIYNDSTIATVDGIYVIIVPNRAVPYNEEIAKKQESDRKQMELARLEERRKDSKKPKELYVEKLIAHIMKNLQVTVKNIHIRYEDKFTNPDRPFAFGVTVKSLNVETIDSNLNKTAHIFYKLLHMINLAIYWNSNADLLYESTDKHDVRSHLEQISAGNNYILEPIEMEMRVKFNQRPEMSNWSSPVIELNADLEKLALFLIRHQLEDFSLLFKSLDRFTLSAPYLKYHPNLNKYQGHYRKWWKFAYNSILETTIQKRKISWSKMKKHCRDVREYSQAWVHKLTKKSLPINVLKTLQELEHELDVFNLNLAREKAELEIDRLGLTRLDGKNGKRWPRWATSWRRTDQKSKHVEAFTNQSLSRVEKAKLHKAINYQMNLPLTDHPTTFVEKRTNFKAGQFDLHVEDSLKLQFIKLDSTLEGCSSAKAISFVNFAESITFSNYEKELAEILNCLGIWSTEVLPRKYKSRKENLIVKMSSVNVRYLSMFNYLKQVLSTESESSKSQQMKTPPNFCETLEYPDFSIDNLAITAESETSKINFPLVLFDGLVNKMVESRNKKLSIDVLMESKRKSHTIPKMAINLVVTELALIQFITHLGIPVELFINSTKGAELSKNINFELVVYFKKIHDEKGDSAETQMDAAHIFPLLLFRNNLPVDIRLISSVYI